MKPALQQLWREKPLTVMGAGFAAACLIYYLIVLLPLNYAVSNLQQTITIKQNQATWLTRAVQEILRLKQETTAPREQSTESTFNLMNQRINEAGWTDLVTDVHQVEQNRVQVTFKSISFSELMQWLNKLFDRNGIYVLQASLQKAEPGRVQATLILEGK